jgi:hypothetical protein
MVDQRRFDARRTGDKFIGYRDLGGSSKRKEGHTQQSKYHSLNKALMHDVIPSTYSTASASSSNARDIKGLSDLTNLKQEFVLLSLGTSSSC